MFSSAKSPGFSFGFGQSDKKKALTPAEEYEQALVTANVFLDDSRARLAREMDKLKAIDGSNYWFYGYFGANMVATMAVCMSAGARVPFLRAYSGWIAVAGGYFGAKVCMGTHTAYLMSSVVRQLDHEVAEARRMDDHTKNIVPDYLQEVDRLTKIKYELMPQLPEAIAARTQRRDRSLNEQADALVDAYLQRKEGLRKK